VKNIYPKIDAAIRKPTAPFWDNNYTWLELGINPPYFFMPMSQVMYNKYVTIERAFLKIGVRTYNMNISNMIKPSESIEIDGLSGAHLGIPVSYRDDGLNVTAIFEFSLGNNTCKSPQTPQKLTFSPASRVCGLVDFLL
jgi:hypothetical protein